ncbi:fibronectin type III domain-containing protein [Patescibacteria group bacterium]|nr:fibronectin type III domain-containing protein [Patescibacteria group bacterium]
MSADPSGNLLQSPVNPPTGLHTFATTADTVAPTISSGPTVTAGRISATVQWTTDEASTTQVKYIAAAGGSTSTVPTTATTLQTEKVTEHYAIITGLTSSTAYNYQIISVDSSGNTLTSPSSSPYPQFTTAGDITDIVAPVISGISSGTPGLNSAAIAWTTDELSYSLVQYGATDALGTFKGAVSIADYTTSHSVALSGLSPGTTYYYKVYSADTSGNLATSSATTFTTAALSISNGPSASASRSGAAISWTTNGLSDSRVEYGAASNLSGSSLTSWQDTTNKVTDHIIYLSSLSPDITYYYRVISRDGNGVSVASSIASFDTTSGAKPVIIAGAAVPADTTSSVTFSATSNNGTPVFLSVEYQSSATLPASYSKESANPSAINSGATGVVALEGLSANNKYYYKLKARDIFGNTQTSASDSYNFTTTIDNIAPAAITGDGLSAGLRIKAPISQNLASTAVTLTWEAPGDDSSTGTATSYDLRYSTSAITDANWSSAAQAANEPLPAVSGATQEMAVAGLAPSTTYYFAIKTSDEIPNISSLSNVLTVATPVQADTTAPVISSVTIGIPSATSVTVTWITDKNSSSLVDFGATAAYGITQGNSADSTKNHSVTLVGLAPSTAYKLRVKSLDSSGNVAINDNSGAGYAFTTASSTAGTLPIISSVQSGSVTATSVVISWTTSVNADSTVGYSSAPDKTYTFESGNSSQLTSHSVTLTNLTPSTDYYYRVKSRNGDQLATSDNNGAGFTFTTLAGADTVPPVISNVQITSVSATKAAITWSTNEASTSYVEFGLAAGSYSSIQGKPSDSTLSHSVELTALTPETAYYFQVRSTDSAGNKAVDNNNGSGYSFTTTSGSTTTCPPAGRATSCPTCETCAVADVTAPKITGVKVADIAFNSAAITWTTDKVSNSMVLYDNVSYGVKQKYGYSSGQLKDSLTSHKITLSNLDSNTTYYFRVSSADSRGNTAESEDQSFKTIAITAAKDKGEAAAVSLKKQFEDIAQTLVKQNLATEENIKDIISRIANPPIIGQEGPVVKDVKSYGATIVWQTDRKANSVVKFKAASSPTEPLAVGSSTSLGASNNWREVGKMDTYGTNHEVKLLGLAPSTTYAYQAKSQDVLGNVVSSETKTFTTSSNSSIFNVNVTNITLNSAKINWETANLSTSLVEYGLTFIYGNQADKGDEKVKLHSVELANLTSGTTYHFRIRSIEESGNILSTEDYTFATYQLPQITKYDIGEVKDNSVELKWVSNIPIDANIRYTDKDTGETKIVGAPEKSLEHNIVLSELSAGKSYKIEIQGRDENNNLAELSPFEVQTGIDIVPPEIVQVRSQAAILSGAEDKVQAIISWKTNELSTSQALWDLGTTKGDTLANTTKLDSNLTTNHISVITSFKPGTVYRFRVASSDKFGNISISSDYSILTPIRRQSVVQMIMSNFEKIFGWTRNLGR